MVKDRRRRDWSALPLDLLVSVANHLRLADIARLPAICGGWGWTLGQVRRGWPPPPPTLRPSFIPLQNSSPWLLLPNEDGVETELCDFLRLSEIKNGVPRFRISPLPEMAGCICVGGSLDGWIATVDIWLNIRILNPLTREVFPLPSICTLSPCKYMTPIYSSKGDGSMSKISFEYQALDISFDKFRYNFVQKIILSSAPPHGIAFLIHGHCSDFSLLAMARVGDLAWTPALVDSPKYYYDQIVDVVYNENDKKFYVLSSRVKCNVIVIDLKNYHWGSFQPPEATVLGNMNHCTMVSGHAYVAFSSNGDLLQVWRQFKSYSANNKSYPPDESDSDEEFDLSPIVRNETIYIKIFKFDPSNYDGKSHSCWIHVKDLGDDAMFLGLSHSTCVKTSDKPWLKRNSVYFIEDIIKYRDIDQRCYSCDGGIFDLKDNKIERFFPSHSKVNWPPPAWFMPSRLQFTW